MFFMHRNLIKLLALACLCLFSLGANAETVTADQVAEAIRNSPNATAWMQSHADEIGALAMFESSGDTTVYNGSCCYGILQMNESNIAYYAGVTPEEFRNWPLQQQVDAWSQLTADGLQGSAPQQLIAAGTFDGRQVDFALVMACVQLGIGNCETMIDAGHCGGFRDSNGTSICDMADQINANMGNPTTPVPDPDPGVGSTPIHYTPITCTRDASGNCLSMSEAMASGFESGSGVTMDRIRTMIQLLLLALVMLVIGNAMLGVWRGFARGQLATADFTHYMARSLLVVLTVAVILTVM